MRTIMWVGSAVSVLFPASVMGESTENLLNGIMAAQAEYKQCLTKETVRLGSGNSESADTVLRAVESVCMPVETKLRGLYGQSPLPRGHIESLMVRDRKSGMDAGVAALLERRAEK